MTRDHFSSFKINRESFTWNTSIICIFARLEDIAGRAAFKRRMLIPSKTYCCFNWGNRFNIKFNSFLRDRWNFKERWRTGWTTRYKFMKWIIKKSHHFRIISRTSRFIDCGSDTKYWLEAFEISTGSVMNLPSTSICCGCFRNGLIGTTRFKFQRFLTLFLLSIICRLKKLALALLISFTTWFRTRLYITLTRVLDLLYLL